MDYTNQKCQICNAKILSDDEVVVCPDCGTPYHKACYMSRGECVNASKHGDGFEFRSEPTQKDAPSPDGKICMRCGSDNPADATTCQICGYPTLADKEQGREYYKKFDPFNPIDSDDAHHTEDFQTIFGTAHRTESLGGVNKDSTIDGEKVSDVATVVGVNTNYYIPKFKRFSDEKKKVSWNWVAFLFPHFWFFLRKCYLQGVAALMINISLRMVMNYTGNRMLDLMGIAYDNVTLTDLSNSVNTAMQDPALASKLISLSLISVLAMVLLIGINAIWGIFGNYIYKEKVIDTVQKKNLQAQEENLSHNERVMLLGRSGGTNVWLALIVILFIQQIISLLLSLII